MQNISERDAYALEMREKVKTLRAQLSEILDSVQEDTDELKKSTRLRYHEIKDELNEMDKSIDNLKELGDDSWIKVKDDISEMWDLVTKEVEDH